MRPTPKRSPVNNPHDSWRLATGIAQTARIMQQHIKFTGDHNFELFYAFVDAAGKVTPKDVI